MSSHSITGHHTPSRDVTQNVLPQIAAEVAAPLQNVNRVTLVSGPNGEVGAAKLTGEVLEIVRKLPKVIEEITGVDMSKVSYRILS